MTEETFNPDDSVFNDFFAEAGWDEVAKAPPNERRVEEITQRAISETIMKESSSFIFLGFSSAISAMIAAFFGSIKDNDEDYKP
ncbi:hypothetical protein [Roseibacillus persicicus]|uniref:Uncharacterized protein n=1 Tax=Roseibacillus persicicus TaxID=454148 RepID=A0A918TCV7_9BACT|nr:hypothetical protein [Roseibacillus persicicus]MDQ8192480.1 hypothetical protein [Roseibacillus persicicus]GHC41344.1 hypothetical protein GCM10007100_02580 [Roseibacillus persicicus]